MWPTFYISAHCGERIVIQLKYWLCITVLGLWLFQRLLYNLWQKSLGENCFWSSLGKKNNKESTLEICLPRFPVCKNESNNVTFSSPSLVSPRWKVQGGECLWGQAALCNEDWASDEVCPHCRPLFLVSKPAWRGGPMRTQPAVLAGVGVVPHTIRAPCFPGSCGSWRRVRSNSAGLGGVCAFGFSWFHSDWNHLTVFFDGWEGVGEVLWKIFTKILQVTHFSISIYWDIWHRFCSNSPQRLQQFDPFFSKALYTLINSFYILE